MTNEDYGNKSHFMKCAIASGNDNVADKEVKVCAIPKKKTNKR